MSELVRLTTKIGEFRKALNSEVVELELHIRDICEGVNNVVVYDENNIKIVTEFHSCDFYLDMGREDCSIRSYCPTTAPQTEQEMEEALSKFRQSLKNMEDALDTIFEEWKNGSD